MIAAALVVLGYLLIGVLACQVCYSRWHRRNGRRTAR